MNEVNLLQAAKEYASKIDVFLINREQSVLSKLVAIGGAMEEESFEIQVKVSLEDVQPILDALQKPGIRIIRQRHYKEYDNYFFFNDPSQGILRYREDDFVDEKGDVVNVRSRLTLIGSHEHLPQVLLSRSRYYAPATHSLRFYREYFKPVWEREIQKDRQRFLVSYKDTEFFINLDTMITPALGKYLEIKARTWSRQDARHKASLTNELITYLGASIEQTISNDYIDMVES
jgi:5-methylthioadenosine/S-adenosylhomocysteine deaminase